MQIYLFYKKNLHWIIFKKLKLKYSFIKNENNYDKKIISAKKAPAAIGPYSQAVKIRFMCSSSKTA
ncbi:hypothetical protein [Clostridium tagluense]|uniref:hypothetical protein n=1 Tax=Clostridium tagluense TaxID=360422 RepID=UPI001CF5DB95|nr:hypothetical protein [Clostridium tagluense]MCB2297557.1 hypothetical protein [Clostridium tagluense]